MKRALVLVEGQTEEAFVNSVIFTQPAEIAAALNASAAPALEAARAEVNSPEEIDLGAHTHPSARILAALPAYRKVQHGSLAAERIGLAAMRAACPHFNSWIERLEGVAAC